VGKVRGCPLVAGLIAIALHYKPRKAWFWLKFQYIFRTF